MHQISSSIRLDTTCHFFQIHSLFTTYHHTTIRNGEYRPSGPTIYTIPPAQIHDAISDFKPLTARPPILDSSYDSASENNEENQWLNQENVPGLKKLKENIKLDLGVLEKFLDDPNCANLPALSTNAPYLIVVWNEVVCARPPIISVFKTFIFKYTTPVDRSQKRGEQHHPPGAKVDVVADNGLRWIRVNTVKNSRMVSEFREIDSYLTDSEDETEEDWNSIERPSLAQTEFDNSVLRMGRSLLKAAKDNPIEGTTRIPRVTLRLTRLDPDLTNDDGTAPDPRIRQTLDVLREMGVDVELGERSDSELPEVPISSAEASSLSSLPFVPTSNINLDLSVLIALISDLTHAPLPQSIEEANRRFVPPKEYREWKQTRQITNGKSKKSHGPSKPSSAKPPGTETDINDLPRDLIKHARALTNQLLQEMSKGLLQEIRDRVTSSTSAPPTKLVFWTTSEARDRCLRIVSKIGGVHEKRRARAIFCLGPDDPQTEIPIEDAEREYWKDSRFPLNFIPLLPIRIFPTPSPTDPLPVDSIPLAKLPKSNFGFSLAHISADILSQEVIPHPRSLPEDLVGINPEDSTTSSSAETDRHPAEIQRATVTKANPRLTAHTVQSMQWGAELGWTTLTANRTSVKAILRELKAARIAGRLGGTTEPESQDWDDDELRDHNFAAIWIVDPRSLAEGMSSQK
ncbi:hypothetical protein M413DRAFT_152949 [Hebeloma cylindrosporum]|uniref:DUF1308 domain-containing protein n=1 Tax=Hebeloma cylindrosporum TaxID=76867 RepID=A0A0C3BYJ0_HEBCY|nr:hypothetical protein M413DRAFT_152949 [Hebeloma cylindrosporum h7]